MLAIFAPFVLAASVVTSGSASDPIADGWFSAEGSTATWSAWHDCGSQPVPAPVVEPRIVRGGRFAALLGSSGPSEIAGDMGICQQVRVPAAGRVMLDFWARSGSTEPEPGHAFAEVGFFDGTSAMERDAPMQMLVRGMPDAATFNHYTFDVTSLSGQLLYVYFGVHGDGHPGAHTWLEVAGVSLVVDLPAHRVT